MPFRVQRSFSSSRWETRGRSPAATRNSHHARDPLASPTRKTTTTTKTRRGRSRSSTRRRDPPDTSFVSNAAVVIDAEDTSFQNENKMGLSNSSDASSTDQLMDKNANRSDSLLISKTTPTKTKTTKQRRLRSHSWTGRRKKDVYQGLSIPIPQDDGGIEAVLPPTVPSKRKLLFGSSKKAKSEQQPLSWQESVPEQEQPPPPLPPHSSPLRRRVSGWLPFGNNKNNNNNTRVALHDKDDDDDSQDVPPVLTTSLSEESRQERFHQSFSVHQNFTKQQRQKRASATAAVKTNGHNVQVRRSPNLDYAFGANVWDGISSNFDNNHHHNVSLESSRVDTTHVSSSCSDSSSSSSSSPHPEPVALTTVPQITTTKTSRSKKWKQRLFFWNPKQPTTSRNNNNDNKFKSKSKHKQRSQSLEPSSGSTTSSPFRRIRGRDLPNNRDWPTSSSPKASADAPLLVRRSRDDDDDISESQLPPPIIVHDDPTIWKRSRSWHEVQGLASFDSNNMIGEGGDEVECEYRGNISFHDWFDDDNGIVDDDRRKNGNDPNKTIDLNRTLSSFSFLGMDTEEMPPPRRLSPGKGKDASASLGEEESLVDLTQEGDDSYSYTSSFASMELGQYAREMQSKSNKLSPSSSYDSDISFRKPGSLRLLCALPGLGSSKKRSKERDFADADNAGFLDDTDDQLCADHESDNNSYLAVSYTEECAQLVMQHSEDMTHDLQHLVDDAQQTQQKQEAKNQQKEQPQKKTDLRNMKSSTKSKLLNEKIQAVQGKSSEVQHAQLRSSQTEQRKAATLGYQKPVETHTGARFAGAFYQKSRIIQHENNGSATQNSSRLGASFPHPAAQLRDNLISQVSSKREMRHTSPFSEKETPSTANRQAGISSEEFPPQLGSFRDGESKRSSRNHQSSLSNAAVEMVIQGDNINKNVKETIGSKAGTTGSEAYRTRTPSPIRTMQANIGYVKNGKRKSQADVPLFLQRRDDPPAPDDEKKYYGNRVCSSSLYCPASVEFPTSHPSCTRNVSSESYNKIGPSLNSSHSRTFGSMTASYDSRTLSSASNASDRYSLPLEERSFDSMNSWGFYNPIRQAAKEVSATFCENIYSRSKDQPATVPFDEVYHGREGGKSRRTPRWAEIRDSDKPNMYERERGRASGKSSGSDRERRKEEKLHDHLYAQQKKAFKPDPPSEVSQEGRPRRQLL